MTAITDNKILPYIVITTFIFFASFMALSAQTDPEFPEDTIRKPPGGEGGGGIEEPSTSTSFIGALPGVIDVSPMGAATYTIPVEVIPGTNGMQPNLSIVYNSMGGMGLLGMKWNLAGLSAVTLCGQTPYYDNNITAIQFNNNDKLALDGNRLLYTGNGYEIGEQLYASEIEDHFRIISHANYLPVYFTGYADDGTVIEYGNTYDSRQRIGNDQYKILGWYVNRITDATGNSMTFHYEQSNGEIWIDSIKYTGNTAAGIQPYAKVSFSYQNLPEMKGRNTCFVGGYGIPQTKLLQYITVYYDKTRARQYLFSYNVSQSGERTAHLKQIFLLGETYAPHLGSTTIEWGEQNTEIGEKITGIPVTNQYLQKYYRRILSGDFNGDGYTDLLVYYERYDDIGAPHEAKMYGQGWRLLLYDPSINEFYEETSAQDDNTYFNSLYAHDVNGDGKDELIIHLFSPNNNEFKVLSLPSKTQIGSTLIFSDLYGLHFGDFDGNGSTEIMYGTIENSNPLSYKLTFKKVETNTLIDMCSPITGLSAMPIYVRDFNGNGKKNIQVGATIYEFNGSNFQSIGQGGFLVNSFLGDFNGDGITDALTFCYGSGGTSTWKINISKGDGSCQSYVLNSSLLNTESYSQKPRYPIMIADIDGDGKDDIIQVMNASYPNSYSRFNILFSKGFTNSNYFYKKEELIVSAMDLPWESFSFGDYNGDGKMDLLAMSFEQHEGFIAKIYSFYKDEEYEFVREIKDGVGKRIQIDYKHNYWFANHSITFYKKFFLSVVDSIKVSNGINNGFNTWKYGYINSFYGEQRRSFLGFKEFISKNNQENKVDSLFFVFENSKQILKPLSQKIYYYTTNTNETIYNFSFKDLVNNRYAPYCNAVVKDYLNDSKTETTTTLSTEGRLTNKTTKTYNTCNSSTWLHSETNTYTYQTITLNGNQKKTVPEKILTTQQYGNNGVVITDTVTYNYSNTGLLNWQRQGNIDGSITTTYGNYTPTGLCQEKTVSAAGCTPRKEYYEYDNTNRFITKIKNHLLHENTMTYNAKTGNILTETNANGLTTTYTYDTFGRLEKINYPDGTITKDSIFFYSVSTPANAKYCTKTTSTGKPELIVYYDILGREVCRNEDGYYYETKYNNKGQVVKTSYPFASFYSSDTVWNYYTYDNLGRISGETAPYIHLSYSYNNRKVTVTDHLRGNIQTWKNYDALGRMVQAEDEGGTIDYSYSVITSGGKPRHQTEITANGATTTIRSNLWGNRLSITDPNAGKITSTYNKFNELTKQTDANGNKTTYQYDQLGRVIQKQFDTIDLLADTTGIISMDSTRASADAITINYTYDNYTNYNRGRGKIYQIMVNDTVAETFTCDSLSRLAQHEKVIDRTPYTFYYDYTATGQLEKLTYPDDFAVKYSYSPTGKLKEIRNDYDNSLIYKVNSRNKFNATTQCEYGNDVSTDYEYNNFGLLTRIKTGKNGIGIIIGNDGFTFEEPRGGGLHFPDSSILNYRYTYDEDIGLMTSRSESVANILETFTYDNLDRLIGISPTAGAAQTFSYLDNGNIDINSLVGSYSYLSNKPHAVTEIEPINDSVFSAANCAVTYNFFNQPTQITELPYRLDLFYGANQQRNKMVMSKNDTLINTRYYINKYYEKEIDFSNNTNHYHYIYGDNGVVALHVATAATDSMYYIHTDHLGSYCAITNSAKMVRQRNWFDPWGNVTILSDGAKGKPPGHYSSPTFLTFSITNRGFTGHEHYLDFKIINMNGRLYDPVIGRFFSPDKYVANSSFTQDFNRYSYARNNPLMYVDPSGEFFWFFPTFSWSKEGGLSIGFTFGIGIPGIASFSANVGYNFKHNDFSASVGATAAFNTVYASYSTQSGFSVGWTAGMTSYAGFPISSNIATVGANYNLTNKTLGGNISAFQWQQDQGWSFNPSLSMAIAPEQFSNLIRGQGFRSNSEVYDRMMSGEALRRGNPFGCQDIINYFGFRGTYDPSKTGGDPGAINGGKIFYGDGAFSGNYDRFALIAYHELRHSQNVKTGKYKGIDLSDRSNSLILGREEWDAYSYNYRNQGLYLNSGENLVGRIQTEGMNAGIYEVGPAGYNTFTPAWWHFIYKIPRLW